MEATLLVIIGSGATIMAALIAALVRSNRRNSANHPGNPGGGVPQPCMEGGNLLGEFRAFVLASASASREARDELRAIKELLLERLPRG